MPTPFQTSQSLAQFGTSYACSVQDRRSRAYLSALMVQQVNRLVVLGLPREQAAREVNEMATAIESDPEDHAY